MKFIVNGNYTAINIDHDRLIPNRLSITVDKLRSNGVYFYFWMLLLRQWFIINVTGACSRT